MQENLDTMREISDDAVKNLTGRIYVTEASFWFQWFGRGQKQVRLLTDLKKDLDEYGEYRNTAWWIVNIKLNQART